ncbi:unnamed protein product [Caenorhabditis sp. 36 PRJEB53466]|nr:unnamed protein product [Caenorhabditis sp. 36 PRJEB53466]
MIIGTGPKHAEKSAIRAANGTWLRHEDRPHFARIFRNLQTQIGALDLSTAEPWQILSYNADGYYAPHYDYLNPATNRMLLDERGNRIATVLVILQIAKNGGTTVFPKIDLNIRPKAGDVVVWLNFETSGESDPLTLHAACPIKNGTKIGATLWSNEPESEEFEGAEYWEENERKQCDDVDSDKTWQWRKAICLTYIRNFEKVKMEIVAWQPALVIYRDMFTQQQVDNFLDLLERQTFKEQQVVNDDGSETYSKYRKANGTPIVSSEHVASKSLFQTFSTLIPALDFTVAEDITALSYHAGGHYAVHNDFLEYTSENEWDWWMREYGNRLATFIIVFKNAASGGATIFPSLGATIKANAGDAFLWFDAKSDSSQEDLTDHAGCPVYSGQKVIATVWIRMKNQAVLEKTPVNGSISARLLIPRI